jgi:hypothetical protein
MIDYATYCQIPELLTYAGLNLSAFSQGVSRMA